MTRRSLSHLLSNEEQSLPEAWGWYKFQRAVIGEEKARVLDAPTSGVNLTTSRYVGKTLDELDEDFTFQVEELDKVTMLGMLVCAEAALRVDFIVRIRDKKRDVVSRAFRDTSKKRTLDKIRLEEDILETWKKHSEKTGIRGVITEFKGVLKLRHWLAHGRYWKPKLGRAGGYDIVDVFEICKAMLQTVDLMPPDSPSAS